MMAKHWIAWGLLFGVVFLSWRTEVEASPRGKRLHKQAVDAYGDGNYVLAKKLWERAFARDREPKYLYNLGRMAQEMDRPVLALTYFERFLKLAPGTAGYRKLKQRAVKHARALRRRVATLTVVTEQSGVRVFVDRKSLGTGPLRSSVRLGSGSHVVSASMRGHYGITKTLELTGGERRTFTIRLSKIKPKVITKPGKMKYPLPRWLPWAGFAAGLAIVGGGAGFLVGAKNKFNEYDRLVGIGTIDEALEKEAIKFRSLGTAFLIIGGVLAGTGLLGVLLNRPKLVDAGADESIGREAPRLQITPVIGSWVGFHARYRF